MRIETILSHNARKFGSRTLALKGRERRTYGEVEERSNRLANYFSEIGLKSGERVAAFLPNGFEIIELMFAAGKANAVFVPLNPKLPWPEMEFLLEDCRPRVLMGIPEALSLTADKWRGGKARGLAYLAVGEGKFPGGFSDYERILASASPVPLAKTSSSEWDIWILSYTSGTTGKPKGICLSHRAKSLCSIIEALEFGTTGEDKALLNTPMHHVHGLVHILSLLAVGGSIVMAERFDPEDTLRLIAEERITELSMVPTMYRRMLASGNPGSRALETVRVARSTGETLSEDLKTALGERFPRGSLNVLYGATEAGPVANLRANLETEKPGSVGLPFLGVEIEIRDEKGRPRSPGEKGEIFIRSPYVFSRYFAAGEAGNSENYERWITLGDIGSLDREGYLFLEGRKRNIIISGGENISPREVEKTLAGHPEVSDVAVIGVPDNRWGERVKAFVELRPGGQATGEDLLDFCKGRLSSYKQPKEIELLSALPRNEMGKVLRKRLH